MHYFFSLPEEKKERIKERFEAKVDRNGPNGCWLWLAYKNAEGYGVIKTTNYSVMLAHRLAWMMHYGTEIPKGLLVCHTCDVRNCVYPSHFFLATNNQNVKDSSMKDRRCSVKLLTRLKLAQEAAAGTSLIKLARKYNIKYPQTVYHYINHPSVVAIYGKVDLSSRNFENKYKK